MNAPAFVCPRCQAPTRAGARFCGRCGREIESVRIRREGGRMWREMKGVLVLYLLLLLVSAAVAALAVWGGADSPGWDLLGEIVSAAIVLAWVFSDRDRVLPLLRRLGAGRPEFRMLPVVFVAVAIVVSAWFALWRWIGAGSISYLEPFREHGWPLWSAFLMISVYPAVFEELAFRGVIQGRLSAILSPREALVLQAAMFAILHVSPIVFPSHFLIGFVLGWLRDRTGSLWPGVMFHAAWNALVLVEEMAGGLF